MLGTFDCLHPWREPELDQVLETTIVKANVAPSASLAWARRVDGKWQIRQGAAGCGINAVFDLASVTKPFTAMAIVEHILAGRCCWSTPLGDILPCIRDLPAASATLEMLASHRAGLPAWAALYRDEPFAFRAGDSPPNEGFPSLETLLRRAASRRANLPVETAARAEIYSDLGYVLLGAAADQLFESDGQHLHDSWARHFVHNAANSPGPFIPTERDGFRGNVCGVVHDENAWMIEQVGGAPGHAGTFGTATEVVRFGIELLDTLAGETARAALLQSMIQVRSGGTHVVGFDTVTPGASSTGSCFGSRTFGHLGFTGTSLWMDPDAQVVAVLLTNRCYPTRHTGPQGIRAARPKIHDAVWQLWPEPDRFAQ